jgi:NAD(P)-dependent dehydrogenase (short-subunit alcohol dehydrogenase family)
MTRAHIVLHPEAGKKRQDQFSQYVGFSSRLFGCNIFRNAFADKVVLITGGTAGIGRATAVAFARQGAKVVVSGRREIEGEESVALVGKAGGKGLFVRADVSREEDVAALVASAVEHFGRLDIAFNNAGVLERALTLVLVVVLDRKPRL